MSDIRASFITLGCAKNEVDSAQMADALTSAGIEVIDEVADADCIIINTCSFIQAATEESLEAIFDAADLDSVVAGQAKIIVAGCMPARYGESLEAELHEASAFVPCSKEDDIVEVVTSLFPDKSTGVAQTLADGPISSYVKISDGCDRFCSFCTIPFIRGRYHSYTYDEIALDVTQACRRGAREIVLIAQDTGRWGSDLDEGHNLAWLLARLAQEFPCTWFRVMYIQPEGVTHELLDVIATHDNICSYLDIPFQHCDEQILKAMNRTGSAQAFLDLIANIRATIPDVVIRTTLIAGFPGESHEAHEGLLDFLEASNLDYVGVFPYSPEEGTRAERMDNQIDEDIRIERAQELRDTADAISHARIAARVGQAMDVLVLGYEEDGQLFGRAMCQAPDVDGVVYLTDGTPGQIKNVTITDTLLYEMEGE